MSALLWAALISMSPVWELRGGIPFALASGVNPWLAFVVCVLANTLAVPITYFFLELIHRRFMHVDSYQSAFDKVMERTRKNVNPYVKKYGAFGLFFLVAIPIPGTGAYTATFAAWFFGLNKWKAFLSILLGIIVAGSLFTGVFSALKLLFA